MNKIKFVGISYWNKETMTLEGPPTPEQWAELDEVVSVLNQKYMTVPGCSIHPEKVQKLVVGLFNNYVDIQVQRTDTCPCHEIVNTLLAIRNYEMFMLNPTHYPREKR
jgi:hypothetical protein